MRKKNSTKKRKRSKILRRCVECDSISFYTDYKLKEISCLGCGLVLVAPYSPDFVTDGFKFEDVKKKKS